jgi:hypothetical protein
MFTHFIDHFGAKLESIRERIHSSQMNALREILPEEEIHSACREAGHEFRRRLLTPVVTVFHMIAAAIWPENSFRSAWQSTGAPRVSSGSLADARTRLPLGVISALFDKVTGAAQKLSEPFVRWRGHRVINIDGFCSSMEDNPELHEAFGTSNGLHGVARYPLARVVVAAFMHTMVAVAYAAGRYRDSENALMREVLPNLQAGDLIVADRHFAGANLYAEYLAGGQEFITRKHPRLKVGRLRKIKKHDRNDFVTELRILPRHRRADESLPEVVRVRMIRVTVGIRGKQTTIWLVTSLLDAEKYPADEIAKLYAARWKVETLIRELKVTCGADVLRSKKPDGIRKEFAARMMAMNMVRMLMIEAALARGEEPWRLSFSNAMRLVTATSLKMSSAPVWRLPGLYDEMLIGIASEKVPERPGRNEPRAVRREQRHYPRLSITRSAWKHRHAS